MDLAQEVIALKKNMVSRITWLEDMNAHRGAERNVLPRLAKTGRRQDHSIVVSFECSATER